jgi:hypothetical protein
VACWPRAITAQASTATVVARLGGTVVGHPPLLLFPSPPGISTGPG